MIEELFDYLIVYVFKISVRIVRIARARWSTPQLV